MEFRMELFDEKASEYDQYCLTPLGHFVDTVERHMVAEAAKPTPGERAIDLGCGTGNYTLWLHSQGVKVTGVDISGRMLEEARKKAAGLDVEFIEANLMQLPFEDNSFDLAVCNVALEFVENAKVVLQEVHRILKPSGRFIAGFIGRQSPWADKYIRRGQEDPQSVYRKAYFYSYAEASSLGWKPPASVQFGLYVGPEEFEDEGNAQKLEALRQIRQDEPGAGFFVVRWDKERAE